MGRPYAAELRELDATYAWSMREKVDALARSVAALAHRETVFVGSGGSLTSAHFATLLHSRITGRTAQTWTPYELASTDRLLTEAAVVICSAGGSNPDVIAAAQVAVKRAPAQLVAITTRLGSPLETLLASAGWPTCHTYATPTKKDGFLATNSLLATVVLLVRAYEAFAGSNFFLPATLDDLLHASVTREQFLTQFRAATSGTLSRSTLVVLHGATTKPAAMDVESRFTEAALASVQSADYRNFAHGRHHWLARHGDSTGVIAFAEEGDDVARKTLALLPAAIPRHEVAVAAGIAGAVAAVCHSLFLGFIAGECMGIDPGRPHVPTFGRRLYHLRAMPALFEGSGGAAFERRNLAIERKAKLPVSALAARGEFERWTEHFRAFVERLASARIRAIVVDYDATLCGEGRRRLGPSAALVKRMNALIDAGCIVAVATGRGKSVRDELRTLITMSARRDRVLIGYHNGAEIGSLNDVRCPPAELPLSNELVAVSDALRESAVISRHATVEAKGQQIAIELRPAGDERAVFEEATRVVHVHATCGRTTVVTSSHSVDILASGVSKLRVVERLVRDLGLSDRGAGSVLCIGDRGRAPGNDADLLRHPLSLSVDQAGEAPDTCWNLAEPGLRFDAACLDYLTRLRPGKSGFRFDVTGVRS
jgi:fructoselysine-6-P-deglycase FrlB-like protein/hydroxymethylpyrimidine pyrophosphatase-like HAD family hydrolase